MTLRELYGFCKTGLECENAGFEARQICLKFTGYDKTNFLMNYNKIAAPELISKCADAVKKRNSGIPLYYILGECEFYGYPFYVGDGVLIPRQDTETLVDELIKSCKLKESPRVLDLCSGSGCIAISASLEAGVHIDAVEYYDKAYEYLCRNIELNKADVTPIKADALGFCGDYDIVVSNPPYIAERERGDLSREVLNEPHTALFADDDGLAFYKKISQNFRNNENITLMFEVGFKSDSKVANIMSDNGFKNIRTVADLGGINRIVIGEK